MDNMLMDRIKGGMYGVAVGDALGGTTEFMTEREIKEKYGYLTEIIGGGVWNLEPGEVTDDTMMTLGAADGILENAEEPVEAIGHFFMEWYRTRPKDIGNIIRHVFGKYEGDWFETAFVAHMDLGQSAGNGSLMRCLPVALAYKELADLDRVTIMQSRMTHYDPRCAEVCVMYNRIAHRLLQGEDLGTSIKAEVKGSEYEEHLEALPDCPPSGFIVHTFRWVLYILLHTANFEEVVQKAANLGGDSDTIGAIAGGLAGIYYSYEGIPARYANAILIKERLDHTISQLYEMRTSC
ncbi:ADP-ribosylglycohydrolase family protein [Paenibacillus sp. FJAT-26967]|uniref:ADP-ribosylglycohydrolase family protein n=1 Tax=Paenibacillus sp. FJAT-26967 TaxID=1729690 RepID=UPI000838494A|nr:ADP-ribosylglycohydrolase family protein [Paenibacillus sp. FJAT-26967]